MFVSNGLNRNADVVGTDHTTLFYTYILLYMFLTTLTHSASPLFEDLTVLRRKYQENGIKKKKEDITVLLAIASEPTDIT